MYMGSHERIRCAFFYIREDLKLRFEVNTRAIGVKPYLVVKDSTGVAIYNTIP